jgi:RimJ/RimL family protein N-acetyltransferase
LAKQILETVRLNVRELETGDLPFVAEMLTDSLTMRFWPRPYTKEEAAEWIERHRARYHSEGCGYWLLSLKNGTPIGQVGVLTQAIELPPSLVDHRPIYGLGYILHHPFWGQGYATEAAKACLAWAFEEFNPPHVIALVRPENHPSIAVAKRIGMVDSGTVFYSGFDHKVFSTTECP